MGMPLRIAHLSDLHICSDDIQQQLADVAQSASRELGVPVDISLATDDSLKSLRRAVVELDPDVLCVSGDITTFGDVASFEVATQFFATLAERSGGRRHMTFVPGNHDVLASQLKKALGLRGRLISFARHLKLRRTTRLIANLLKVPGVKPDPDILANYRRFIDSIRADHSASEIGKVSGKPVWVVGFNSVSTNPLWLNLGQTSKAEFHEFYTDLQKVPTDSILIALVHHNPISSPDAVENPLLYAYNSMPGSALLSRELQHHGVDLVLFGHQHRQTSCTLDHSVDEPNHLNLLGAASATCGETPGFNYVEVLDRFRLRYSSIVFNTAGGYSTPADTDYRLMMVDLKRTSDQLTVCTKNEIRYFRYLEYEGQEHQWVRMHEPGAEDLLIIGPRLKRIMKERRSQLRAVLAHNSNARLRILLSDPSLYERIESLSGGDRDHLKRMWGEQISWEDQSRDAMLTLKALDEFRVELPNELRTKLEVRLAHTLLPIGAVARDADKEGGAMLIRLLPVGLMGGPVKRPILRLTRRHPAAVYSFYQAYIEELWRNGHKNGRLQSSSREEQGRVAL